MWVPHILHSFLIFYSVNGFSVTSEDVKLICRTDKWTELDLKIIQDENDIKRITSEKCAVNLRNPPMGKLTKKVINLLPKPSLKFLQISGKLHSFDDESLSSFRFLKYLILSDVDLDNSETFYSQGAFAKNVEQLDLSQNRLSNLSFLQTESKKMRKLNLYENRLQTVPNELENFPNLQELTMYGNKIKDISLAYTLADVTYLDLSRNSLRNLSGLAHFPNVVILNLTGNFIKDMTDVFFQVTRYKLEELLLDSNNIEYISFPTLFNFPKLKKLSLENNDLRKIIPTVNKNQNMALEDLNLSNNELDEIPYNFLRWFPNLKTLKLNKNKLSYIRTGTFINLNNIRNLDLSNNNFVEFNVKRLIPLESLHDLDLSFNKIEIIDYFALVSNVPSLGKISIDENALICENLVEMLNFFDGNNVIVEKGKCSDRSHIRGICCEDKDRNDSSVEPNLISLSILRQNQKKLDQLIEKINNISHHTEVSSQPLQESNVATITKATFWTGLGIIIICLILILIVLIFSIIKKEKVVLPVHI